MEENTKRCRKVYKITKTCSKCVQYFKWRADICGSCRATHESVFAERAACKYFEPIRKYDNPRINWMEKPAEDIEE